ncbi:hypothetical protein [Paenibacillus sp. JDR-2]|uniref:hypothetical protein n=1 Tax=Paenibacillus sp. (strain JDR-2) TaxID=324057 RepID=UPI0001666BEB|nr:hypothetical protein [Paenibacillus sp. JDR-2]ACT00970.1 hypothetical protein Pjdr2_2314 [Paenibacillus sp. JDR-2]
MGMYGDWFIMLVAGAFLLFWAYRGFYRWLHQPASVNRLTLGKGGELAKDDENIQFLERSGYEVVSGKHRVPIGIELDGQSLNSRLYIDYIAEQDGKMYIVKAARERMPMDWTGSGVRDRLLVYSLLLPECAGVLFVDVKEQIIRRIIFDISD